VKFSSAILAVLAGLSLAGACGDDGGAATAPSVEGQRYSLEDLKDPQTCSGCHPRHYKEWSGSMHAYASIDPVFVAMNKRGQRETDGKLGNFCVNCHAPMAVRENLVSEGGLDLDKAPKWAQGVTCYFCHNAVGLENPEQHFNGNIKLANDRTMRGSFEGIDPGVHGVARSSFHSKNSRDSSVLCGSCHDVVNDKGVHIERTFAEYKKSIFSHENTSSVGGKDTCQGCHMPVTGEMALIATNPDLNTKLQTVPRDHHEHRWPGVDIAMTDDFPEQSAQRFATECEIHRSANLVGLSVDELGVFNLRIETQAGHSQPSGTAQDRRLWLEFIAYDANGKVVFESGTIKDGEVEQRENDDRPNRQKMIMFRDHMFGDDGQEVHMFWEAASYKSSLLKASEMPNGLHYADVSIAMPFPRKPARAVMRLRMRPMGMDVLQSLVDSGDLDPKFLEKVPTFTINNSYVEWRAEDGNDLTGSDLRLIEEIPDNCDPLLR
jgi:hypothetical protein